MVNDNKIEKKGQLTPSGGIIYKGTNYRATSDGMQAVASMNPKVLKSMGVDEANIASDGRGVFDSGIGFQSFGIQHKQVYSDPGGFGIMGSPVDARPEMAEMFGERVEQKALTTTAGGAGTAGYAMVPIYVDPRVVDTTRKFTPLVDLIPRVANQGTTADFNKITAKGSAAFQPEDAAIAEANDTYDRVSVGIKYAYAVGRVTGPMLAAMPPYTMSGFNPSGTGLGGGSTFSAGGAPNAKQLEVLVKTRAMRELQENTIVNGDTTANDYSGIITSQSTTNKVDKNTTALTLDDITTAIQYAFDDGGRPNLAVCSSSVYSDIQKLMMDQFKFTPTTKLPWGFETLAIRSMVGEIPVIPSMYMSNTTGSKAIYFLDMSAIEMRVLQDLTYQDLAKTNDSEKFMLKVYEALVMKNTAFNSFVGEIA